MVDGDSHLVTDGLDVVGIAFHQGRQRVFCRPQRFRVVNVSEPRVSSPLTAFQRESIHFFVHAAQALSIPRSVGEIYGLLYATETPLTMDEIIERLTMSKGSASQGLRWLRAVNAVRAIYVAGERRDHFEAETALRKLATGFLRETVEPQLQRAGEYLDGLDHAAGELRDPAERRFAEERRQKLRRWHGFAARMLPLFLKVADRV